MASAEVPLDVPAGTLSIEQRKIMELARALITDPDFLVLDEISQRYPRITARYCINLSSSSNPREEPF